MNYIIKKTTIYFLLYGYIAMQAHNCFSNNTQLNPTVQPAMVETKSIFAELASIKATPGDVLLGFVASLGLGFVAGTAYGLMSHIVVEELSERGFKDFGVSLAWCIAPIGRSLTVIAANLIFQLNGIRANYIVSLLTAQGFDWLIYFEKMGISYLDPAYKKQYCKKCNTVTSPKF